ncbi:MAG: aminotransferase class V-fold PLP-dependent enzyme [Culicoidibacterales bacterium]
MEQNKFIAEFPILTKMMNGKRLVYLDSAATSLTPECVLAKMNEYYREYGVNVHRGVYAFGAKADAEFEAVRDQVQHFIGAASRDEIVFTRGTTSAINQVAFGYVLPKLQVGDEIVTSMSEHHANFVPWQVVAQRSGAVLKFAPLDENGAVTPEALRSVMSEKTRFVALNQMSNVMSALHDVQAFSAIAHEFGAEILIDGAQAIPHLQVAVQTIDCDFYAFSGHKMFGPTGVGVLYGKAACLANMEPIEYGGAMIDQVCQLSTTYKEAPYRFETGTPMIAEVIGLGAAITYLQSLGYEAIQQQIESLRAYAMQQLKTMPHVEVYNPNNHEAATIAFNIKDVHSHDAVTVYDLEGVAIRAGHLCAQPMLSELTQGSLLRMSLQVYNTKADIDRFIAATKKASDFLDVLFL